MVLADTGFWVALLWRRDPWHVRARAAYERHNDDGLMTTWPVVTEACYLLGKFLGEEAKAAFLDRVADQGVLLHPLGDTDSRRIAALIRRYADLPMDLADASLVILAEHLGHGRILSTDMRDFGAYRWKNHAPFHNLLMAEDV
ncbi:MAG: type II toxin-antitoxin system VapC family toxin [Rhodocyclaceae bacterium]